MSNYTFEPIRNPDVCAECGSTNGIELHHPIPISMGGKCVIPLCNECHGKAHDMKRKNIGELTKEGLKRAKERGQRIGRPPFGFENDAEGKLALHPTDYELLRTAVGMHELGIKQNEIAKFLRCSESNVSKRLKRWKTKKKKGSVPRASLKKLHKFLKKQDLT
jgi:hypothetical protein